MSFTSNGRAQGIERESLSGMGLAQALLRASDNQVYNMRLGPVQLRVDAYLPIAYNDNINLAKTGRISDFVVTPQAAVHGTWKVSELNTLTFDLGIGYQAYLSHSQYNDLLITPDTQASFNFFVGDVALNLHEYLDYSQDPSAIGQLSNQTRLARFINDVGVTAKWDLSAVILELDYDHSNFWVTQNTYSYLTNQADSVTPKVTIPIDTNLKTGVSATYSNTRYDKSFENDYQTISAGPFLDAQLTENLSIEAQAGGYFSMYARGGGNGDNSDVSSYYANGGITHRISEFDTQALTVGREYIPGLTSNFTERVFANYQNTWKATEFTSVSGNLWWENLDDSDAVFRENSNRYGVGLDVQQNVAERLTLTFNYQYILKDANPSFLSYYQNVGTLGLRYSY